jgi:hypothetical protein
MRAPTSSPAAMRHREEALEEGIKDREISV